MDGSTMGLGDIERHFWLNRSVAREIGVNLSKAMAEGRLSSEGYAELVTRCHAGGCHEACQQWLAAQTGDRPDGTPEYCANADILERLR